MYGEGVSWPLRACPWSILRFFEIDEPSTELPRKCLVVVPSCETPSSSSAMLPEASGLYSSAHSPVDSDF